LRELLEFLHGEKQRPDNLRVIERALLSEDLSGFGINAARQSLKGPFRFNRIHAAPFRLSWSCSLGDRVVSIAAEFT
jgi:hypothetical protein